MVTAIDFGSRELNWMITDISEILRIMLLPILLIIFRPRDLIFWLYFLLTFLQLITTVSDYLYIDELDLILRYPKVIIELFIPIYLYIYYRRKDEIRPN